MTGHTPALRHAIDWIDRGAGAIDWLSRIAMGAALLGVLTMLLLQVAVRYVVNFPLPWVEELAVYLSGYIAMIGTAVCLRMGFHLQVDLLRDRLGGRVRILHFLLVNLVVAGFGYFLLKYGIRFVELGAGQTSPSSYFPVALGRLAMPVGGGLLIIQSIVLALRATDALIFGPRASDQSLW
ncbi:TRAP transporter small permease [Roseinatronobacter alkalisoli]|uniref:TRAP transporter small permease protein n=1 Tax=Roseinatronobacter alkalisoli TaxID=3028235 RepID=A0ABT5TCQ6_9RHOB|nr:TRAP transporter small permease [Roseinatronobacter sp. HJB301]MDD7972754.1 TRAP transporter small permease [Roseinatronobacter sp. HJB301]